MKRLRKKVGEIQFEKIRTDCYTIVEDDLDIT